MDRRTFIKITAVTGTSAALASCGSPENQLIRFLPAEDIVPGIAVWKPGVCPVCQAGCGLTVRVMDADADVVRDGQRGLVRIAAAKKLEGAPAHPVNGGALCARGQAAIQITYHPDRITQPMRRAGDRGTGRYEPIAWDEAVAEVTARLQALADGGNPRALAILAQPGSGHRHALVGQFAARFGAAAPLRYELFGHEVLRRANALSFGRPQLPTFDLANARLVLGFGADFLGTWNSPVAQSLAYGRMRQGRSGIRGTFVQIESRMSQTGANADRWVPVRPGTEGVLALGLAHALMAGTGVTPAAAGRAGAVVSGWSEGLAEYTPARVEMVTGTPAARIEQLAAQLADTRPAVAVVGGAPLAQSNGLFTAVAVNALNALLGAVDQPGGLSFMPQLDLTGPSAAQAAAAAGTLQSVAADALSGVSVPQVVMLDGVNPVFTAPKAWRVREALEKVPYIVSFGSFLDETSVLADLVLPDHTFLETWSEAAPESGAAAAVVSAAPPVMRPLYDTRAMPDVLLEIGRQLRQPLGLPWQSFEEMIASTFMALPPAAEGGDAWTEAQGAGFWTGPVPAGRATPAAPAAGPAAGPLGFEEARFDGDPAQFPFYFQPYASPAFLDGAVAHLPWLQELPDPLTSAMWSSWVEINPATAARLGIQDGDVVDVTSTQGTIRTAAVLTPGIAPDLLAMPAGQGHTMFTRYATGRGANPVEVLAPVVEPTTGALAWAATRVRLSRVGPPDGRLVLFAGATREHPEEPR